MTSRSALIVDDEKDICFLLGKVLKGKNYVVTIASNLHDGLDQIEKSPPSILFLDIHLPDGSGLDAIKKIRKKNPAIKIIVMSAYDGMKERALAEKEGADLFIGKPLSNELINRTLENIHEHSK